MRTRPPTAQDPTPSGAPPDRVGVVIGRLGAGVCIGAIGTIILAALVVLTTTERLGLGLIIITTLLCGLCPLLWAAVRRRIRRQAAMSRVTGKAPRQPRRHHHNPGVDSGLGRLPVEDVNRRGWWR